MEHIGKQLATIEQNMRLNSPDPIAQHGFTQVPNFILRNRDLSTNAKTVYSLLLSYAWHNNLCFPGQQRLAEHMGSHVSTVNRRTVSQTRFGVRDAQDAGICFSGPNETFVPGLIGATVDLARWA